MIFPSDNRHKYAYTYIYTFIHYIYVDKSKYTQICASFTTVMKVLTLERTDKKMNEHVTAI